MRILKNIRLSYQIILVIVIIGTVSAIVGNAIDYVKDVNNAKNMLISNTILQTKLISEYCGLPLEFNYPDNATEVLQKLASLPDICDGVLFTLDNKIFASYHKSGFFEQTVPEKIKNKNYLIEGNYLHIIQPVIYKNKNYGLLYVRANVNWSLIANSLFRETLLIISITLIIIVVLAFLLQRGISSPIVLLTEKMNLVAQNADYSVQIDSTGSDEIGKLYAGLKKMLHEINRRETELIRTTNALRESELQIRKLMDRMPVPIILLNSQGEIIFQNDSFIENFGYNVADISTIDLFKQKAFMDEESQKSFDLTWIKTIKENQYKEEAINAKEYKLNCKNGEERNVEIAGIIMGDLILLNFVDLTEHKNIENVLTEKNKEIEIRNQKYLQINEELVKTNIELVKAKEKAEESDRLKTSFLQNMSHEIRTPMNAIMGFSSLMVEVFDNKSKLEKYTKIINQRCSDLLGIINDLLDIAKIESGQLTLIIEEFKLDEIFSEIKVFFTEYQQRLNKEHIKFIVNNSCVQSGLNLNTDKIKLKQILINLITNAFKFTDNGSIVVTCNLEGTNNIVFSVTDTGIGIPLEKQVSIFERFVQLDDGTTNNFGGTGLGLPIVKGLVNILKGNIWIESEPGKGSSFYFSLPVNIAIN
jgi:PAS domain S-box-containing protein